MSVAVVVSSTIGSGHRHPTGRDPAVPVENRRVGYVATERCPLHMLQPERGRNDVAAGGALDGASTHNRMHMREVTWLLTSESPTNSIDLPVTTGRATTHRTGQAARTPCRRYRHQAATSTTRTPC
ncbi:hypothetical protein E2562_009635 [Oryza meyeriana var. granulata]|uniref:Uncharacterized protein n=1 Tax=Oryza meyeriana var. granulata TaxID=110450 RepID=A0A6G1D0N0_9ORYZ|nr:hypothetical protein E2562_009635 [Oryza meyeriana var. granulata]